MAAGPLERLTLAVPMPIEWQAGFGYLVVTSDQRPAYLLGDEWDGSRIWFFPASAAVKLPVTATLAVLAGAAGWTLVEPGKRRRAAAAVGAPAVVVAAFLLLQPLNLGLRLAVPVLALVFVAAAPVMCLGRRLAISAVAVLAAGQIASMVVAYPHSLAWTPPPNSNGYRVVSDSSIDFGQANDDVRRREASQPFVAASLIAPRGFDVLPGVPRVEDVNPAALVGDIAVSATELTVRNRQSLSWLWAYCPVDVIGDSVLVYRFDAPPDVTARADVPAAPCDGTVSQRH